MFSLPLARAALLGSLVGALSQAAEPGSASAGARRLERQRAVDGKLAAEREEGAPEYKPRDIRGKSLYFVVTDYFAGPPAGQPFPADCDGLGWCNGTIKGITDKLDYIQSMGFEGIWVTPLVKQFYGPSPDGTSGYGQYGYWAADWYEIDPNYGTAEELKELSREVHRRDMVFVYDIVLNHVGPVHGEAVLASYRPFNRPEYLHQRDIQKYNVTFDEYARGYAFGGKGFPPPVQGVGPGAMCRGDSCSNYRCPVDPGRGRVCPVKPIYLGDLKPPRQAPGPRDIFACGPGDFVCPGYDPSQVVEGWFYDLGDLNHSHPFVREELIRWGKHMRDTYQVDGFRLDTAPYVSRAFLADFQAEVKIPILGEVTASNWTFFRSYAPDRREGPVLEGLLNFYLQGVATPGFCGPPAFFPGADLNLSRLAANMQVEFGASTQHFGVNDPDLLGNFVDNHDSVRLAAYCSGVMSRMRNALAWTFLTRGMPIVYYGTENFFNTTHPAMWNAGYGTGTPGWAWLRTLNALRRQLRLHTSGIRVEFADANRLVFSRRSGGTDKMVFVFLNNFDDGVGTVEYDVAGLLPPSPEGRVWVDALSAYRPVSIQNGRLLSSSTDPLVLVLSDQTLPHRRLGSTAIQYFKEIGDGSGTGRLACLGLACLALCLCAVRKATLHPPPRLEDEGEGILLEELRR